jgi:hypothetical protein
MKKCFDCELLGIEITRNGFLPNCKLNKRKFKERKKYDPKDKDLQKRCAIIKEKK